jgi:biopolymer transport protein ExbD
MGLMDSERDKPGFHQMVFAGFRRDHRISMGLRMTPMIDVIFLLLIFFVLSAKFQEPEKFLPVFVGTNSSRSVITPEIPLSISVSATADACQISVANHPPIILADGDPEQALLVMARKVQQTMEATGSVSIEVYCDDAISWDVVVKVYDVLYALGTENITFRIDE